MKLKVETSFVPKPDTLNDPMTSPFAIADRCPKG